MVILWNSSSIDNGRYIILSLCIQTIADWVNHCKSVIFLQFILRWESHWTTVSTRILQIESKHPHVTSHILFIILDMFGMFVTGTKFWWKGIYSMKNCQPFVLAKSTHATVEVCDSFLHACLKIGSDINVSTATIHFSISTCIDLWEWNLRIT